MFIVPVERRCNPKRCLVIGNGFLRLALGAIHETEEAVTFAGRELPSFVWGEIKYAGCGFFCGVELVVVI